MASTAAAMIAQAASQIGTREGRDADGNWNNKQKYGDWYAKAIGNQAFAAVAWCDIFVSWCAEFSGNADIIPKCAYVPSRLNYYRAQKRTGVSWPPAPGDLGIIMRGGVAQHIFLVEKVIGTSGTITVQTIEGNTNPAGSPQGNGVYRLHRKDWFDNDGVIYCRPAYRAPAPAVTMSKPVTKPAPAGPRIKVANLRPGLRNADAKAYNDLLWKAQGPAYRKANEAAWMRESSSMYGPMTEKVTYDTYRYLIGKDAASKARFGPLPTRPCWPGAELIRYLGGIPE